MTLMKKKFKRYVEITALIFYSGNIKNIIITCVQREFERKNAFEEVHEFNFGFLGFEDYGYQEHIHVCTPI